MIVLDDADVDAAVSAASVGRFFNCGQACLAVKRALRPRASRRRVRREAVGQGRAADASAPERRRDDARPAALATQRDDARGAGGLDARAGRRAARRAASGPTGTSSRRGWFYEPTLILEPPHDSEVAVEEVFGPALPIWRVGGLDEAIERANASQFGLGSSIWTRDLTAATIAAERLEAGYTWINSGQIVYDELPFGGFGESGLGKEHGERGARLLPGVEGGGRQAEPDVVTPAVLRGRRGRLPVRDAAANGHGGRPRRVRRRLRRLQPVAHGRGLRRQTIYGERIAHGALVLSLATGLRQRAGLFDGTLMGLLEIRELALRAPVRIGDTIRVRNEVREFRPTLEAGSRNHGAERRGREPDRRGGERRGARAAVEASLTPCPGVRPAARGHRLCSN